jgi:hypothetical protein
MTIENTMMHFFSLGVINIRCNRLQRLLLVGCLLFAGCTTTLHKPFEKFAQSAAEARTGLAQALEQNRLESRERFKRDALRRFLQGDLTLVEQLRIHPTGDPLGLHIEKGPFFITSAKFKSDVDRMTAVMVEYAQLLSQLASPDLLPKETFDELAKQLNDNANGAIAAIRGEQPDAAKFAILSTATARVLEGYFRFRRRSELKKALSVNQTAVVEFSQAIHQAVLIAATSAWMEYNSQLKELQLALDPQKEQRAFNDRVQVLEDTVAKLRVKKAKLEAELDRTKADLQLDEDKAQLKLEVKKMQKQVNMLNAQVAMRAIDLEEAKRQADKGPKIKTKAELSATLEAMMALYEAYAERIDVLRKTDLIFNRLPAAHMELVNAADSELEGLEAINALLNEGMRLQTIYSHNRLKNEIKLAQAQADTLTARADELGARVASEELRKGLLEISLTRVKAKSAADPENEDLRREVEELQNRFNNLDDRIRRLKLVQAEAYKRATAAQTEVERMKGNLPKTAIADDKDGS